MVPMKYRFGKCRNSAAYVVFEVGFPGFSGDLLIAGLEIVILGSIFLARLKRVILDTGATNAPATGDICRPSSISSQ